MSRYSSSIVSTAAVAFGFAVAACNGDRAEGPLPEGGPVLSSVAGVPMTEGAMRQRLAAATRLVALSLGSPAVRAHVRAALSASTYPEHKLHLGRFLRGSGRQLLAGMAAGRRGATEQDVLAQLDSLVDVEFYMPVPAHRGRWRGGREVIVAAALRDHEIPIAYDVDGNAVALASASVPPDAPTLALVPVETDFSALPSMEEFAMLQCEDVCEPLDGSSSGGGTTLGGGAVPGASPSVSAAIAAVGGVAMTFAHIPGGYEGFMMGNPEFEVHAIAVGSNGALKDYQCTGEHGATAQDQPGVRSSLYAYDQNDEVWTGGVLLLSKDQATAAQAGGGSVIYWIWEDDNTECKIVKDPGFVGTLLRGLPDALHHGLNAITALFKSDTTKSDGLKASRLLGDLQGVFSAFQNDDVVGFLVDKTEVGMDWPDATHAIVLKNPDGTFEIRGRAKLVPVSP
jgi:hypothetical protein